MNKRYFEAHVTMEAPPSEAPRVAAAVKAIGWRFSAINGDPILGDGVKMYATTHWNERIGIEVAVRRLHQAAGMLGAQHKVVRRKVELVLYDDRSSAVSTCDGACPECHAEDLTR